jgi:hypothetical protein
MKFIRSFSRTYLNNIWTSDDYTIVRNGSAYWGWTGYDVWFKGRSIAQAETFIQAKAAARQHAEALDLNQSF